MNQTFTDFELIIWDDVSTDDSWEIICSYEDKRIRAFQNEVNTRKVVNTVLLSGEARGKYIAIHHSDDVWEPEKLARQVAFLESHHDVGAVFTQVHIIDERGNPLSDETNPYFKVFEQPNRNRFEWLRYFALHANGLCHPSVLIRRQIYETLGVYSYAMTQVGDFEYWVRLAMHTELFIIPEKLTRFRVLDLERNVSGNRPEVHVRGQADFHFLFRHYRKISSIEELCLIFPEAQSWVTSGEVDILFVLGRVLFDLTPYPALKLLALELIMEGFENPKRRKIIREQYGFTENHLRDLAAKYDIFSLVQTSELQRRLMAMAAGNLVRSGIYLFDEHHNLLHHDAVEVILPTKGSSRIEFQLEGTPDFHHFAWDPVENNACATQTFAIEIEDAAGNLIHISPTPSRHNGTENEEKIWFYTFDPRQYYNFGGQIRRITFIADIHRLDPGEVEWHHRKAVAELENKFRLEKEDAASFRKKLTESINQFFDDEAPEIIGELQHAKKERLLILDYIDRALEQQNEELAARDQKNLELKQQISTYESALDSKSRALEQQNEELAARDQKNLELEQQISTYESALDSKSRQILSLMEDLQVNQMQIQQFRHSMNEVEQSLSWKITAPLRKMKVIWRQLTARG